MITSWVCYIISKVLSCLWYKIYPSLSQLLALLSGQLFYRFWSPQSYSIVSKTMFHSHTCHIIAASYHECATWTFKFCGMIAYVYNTTSNCPLSKYCVVYRKSLIHIYILLSILNYSQNEVKRSQQCAILLVSFE